MVVEGWLIDSDIGPFNEKTLGFHEKSQRRLAERIGPIACCVRLADVNDGSMDHFIDGTQDRVIKVAVQVGVNNERI